MRTDSLGRQINEKSHEHLIKHGGCVNHKTTYQCWQDMKQRCYNQKSKQYKNYGARGIAVCERWINSFEHFFCDMGRKPDGMSIERIDVNGMYEPSNCKWASNRDQQRNKRTVNIFEHNGLKMTMREWAKHLGIHEGTLSYRLNKGYPVDMILSKEKFLYGSIGAMAARGK